MNVVDRSDPLVWGGELRSEEHGSMRGYELPDPSTVTEFCREVHLPPGMEEKVAVPLGTLYGDTEQEISRTGSMGGRLWGHVSGWLGGDD